jgi:cobalt-zinc-cadmium resistance protein CzcA
MLLWGFAGAQDVKMVQVTGLPMLSISPRREMLARYGVSMSDVQEAVATATGGRQAGEMFNGDRPFVVVVRLPETLRTDVPMFGYLPVALPGGGSVLLAENHRPRASGRAEPDHPRDWQAPRGDHRQCARPRPRRVQRRAAAKRRRRSRIARRLFCRIWRDVRAAPVGDHATPGRRAAGTDADLRAALHPFGSAKNAAIVFWGVPLALTGGVAVLVLLGIRMSIGGGVAIIAL